ncbi:MAG TPA: molybdopterin-dependent oxidoreductase [Miltoncostaeaceae bacterium]|nr:molybdopterin-dependent oxidoreductase [Miltoncostaeaceae bacterium]
MSTTRTGRRTPLRRGRIGESVLRADGDAKVQGRFAYASDLSADGMLWGTTLRSPYPSATVRGIDVAAALAVPGVRAVLTHEDVPGRPVYGMEVADQPVLAAGEVRYEGEPVAIVAADHPETARRAAARIAVDYAPTEPLTSAAAALADGARALHPGGNLLRAVPIRHGDPDATADVVVRGVYEVGMQDQAFLGPESALAVPAEDGGVDLHIATQWLHVDQAQVAASLDLPLELTRLHLAGVGGAFGGREDLSMQVHVAMLALRTGRPVKMVYSREESFYGHVHRHPARMTYEHGATRDGRLVYVKADVTLDGGAYASSSTAVVANAATFACGPYAVPNASIDARVAYTNNPPCGAMRGFGAVQVAFAHESQMDRLAAALGMDPVELRIVNAIATGDRLPTGQVVDGPAPVRALLEELRAMPLPPLARSTPMDLREMPGGVSNVTHGEGTTRGVGFAVGFKNIAFAEGFDDFSTARVRLVPTADGPVAEVQTAAAEVGQGLVTVIEQIARTELDVDQVVVLPSDTSVGSAGSTSASRQTWVTGGAVQAACRRILARLAEAPLGDEPIEETAEYRHRPTQPLDPRTGQGDSIVALGFAAHRAVCDVDVELGLVRAVEVATTQDVGRVMNPLALEGQIQGGIAQGVGLALMEEIQMRDGRVRNASFTDYLMPTVLDMPAVRMAISETPHPHAPYGLNGVGEMPTIASTPAVVAAVRDATGRELPRVPLRPSDIAGVG